MSLPLLRYKLGSEVLPHLKAIIICSEAIGKASTQRREVRLCLPWHLPSGLWLCWHEYLFPSWPVKLCREQSIASGTDYCSCLWYRLILRSAICGLIPGRIVLGWHREAYWESRTVMFASNLSDGVPLSWGIWTIYLVWVVTLVVVTSLFKLLLQCK